MKTILKTISALLLALAAAGATLAEEPVVVVNPKNEFEMDEDRLRLILTGKERFWDGGKEVIVAILRSDPSAEELLRRYCGMSSSKFKNHWQRMAFSGRGKMPKLFSDVDDLAAFVYEYEGAIGVVTPNGELRNLRTLH